MTLSQTLIAAVTGIALLTGPLHAGGPVLEGEEPLDADEQEHRGGWILPVLGILVIGALIASGGNCHNSNPQPEPEGGC